MEKKFFHPTVYYNPFNKKTRVKLIVVTEDANGLLSASFASADEVAEYESMKNKTK